MRLVAVLAAVALGSAGAGVVDARPATAVASGRAARVAQVQNAFEIAIGTVAKAEAARAALVGERARVMKRYEAELREIDKLKRQKASWRRDRALRGKLAATLETARVLAAFAGRLEQADADVARARAAGVIAIDRMLPSTSVGQRRADMVRKRAQWAPPPPPSRKILIPDEQLDPLADPEELDQQADALRDAEAELSREVAHLEQQATRFDRMAELRKQHDRAEELARRDESDPRRLGTAARATLESVGAASDAEGAPDDGIAPPSGEDLDGSRDFATALSDVVDPSTVDALRRAERSNDPGTRAAVARRARDAVNQRLSTMRKRRAAIEGRARELRAP